MIGFFTAPRFVFGTGALEQLSGLDARRPAVIVASHLAADTRTARVVEELAKRETSVALLTAPDGPASPASAGALAAQVRERGPDWIVAVGGGRVLDLARAAWLLYERPELELATVGPLTELGLRAKARFVAVPTTSGAGAESSPTVRLWNPDGSVLRASSRELVPDWAILDAAWPLSQPKEVTADAAAEALGHALEALVSAWTNPLSEALAREATAELVRALPRLAREPEDLELRGAVHHAAAMAGLAAANGQDGAAAALAEALAPGLGLSYGRCLGILLPFVVEFNYPSARDRYQALGPLLADGGSIAHRSDLPRRLRAVLEPLGIPASFAAAGVPPARLEEALAAALPRAERNGAALANPRVPSSTEWAELARAAFHGRAVGF